MKTTARQASEFGSKLANPPGNPYAPIHSLISIHTAQAFCLCMQSFVGKVTLYTALDTVDREGRAVPCAHPCEAAVSGMMSHYAGS